MYCWLGVCIDRPLFDYKDDRRSKELVIGNAEEEKERGRALMYVFFGMRDGN